MKNLVEPIKPVEPEKDDEALSELRTALAAAVTALGKNKNIIITNSDIRTWSEPEGQISFKIKSHHAKYVEYDKECRKYNDAKRLYDNTLKAKEFGIPLDQYLEAKKKFEEYQAKKCDKLPDRDIEYFIAKVTNPELDSIKSISDDAVLQGETA